MKSKVSTLIKQKLQKEQKPKSKKDKITGQNIKIIKTTK